MWQWLGINTMEIDPYRSYNFKLLINGRTEAHFTKCTGLTTKVEPINYREHGTGELVRRIRGPMDFGNVTLQYGMTNSQELREWLINAASGKIELKSVSIILLSSSGSNEMMHWNLSDAWPSQWQGAPLDMTTNEMAIESLTLVFENAERA